MSKVSTKNKNYTKHGSKSGPSHPEKGLGRTLFKSRFNHATKEVGEKEKWLHTAAIDTSNIESFKSVTEQSSLDEFLNTAELAGADFEAAPKSNVGLFDPSRTKMIKDIQTKFKDICLRIPRRPLWKGKGPELDGAELQRQEREAFLEWRRNLALAQQNEHLSMTPFEKNLDFWRQLWRVIERSDIVVQIVDARNPILFHCEDLETYVKEVDEKKMSVLLINKSDFLSEKQRLAWLKYYTSKNTHVVFWSAALATTVDLDAISETTEKETEDEGEYQERSEGEDEGEEEDEDLDEVDLNVNKFKCLPDEEDELEGDENDEEVRGTEEKDKNSPKKLVGNEEAEEAEDDEDTETEVEDETEPVKVVEDINNNKVKKEGHTSTEMEAVAATAEALDYEISEEEREKCKILSRAELIHMFKTLYTSPDKAMPGITTIGLVGYPNVGKSSTINAIMEGKKVAVSETPGKTKHYQTMYFDDELLLCDCPGLVFPSFVSSRGELILNGVLPIDQMRDYSEPVYLAAEHIPRSVFEMYYGITLPQPKDYEDQNRIPTAEELCSAYAIYRGYMNHKGMPDVSRSARYILKDYVNGKLLYCYAPPGLDAKTFQDHKYEQSKEVKYFEKTKKLQQRAANMKPQATTFDKEFFSQIKVRALTKGGVVGCHRTRKVAIQRGADLNKSLDSQLDNNVLTKKHHKKKLGGGKLRRVTSHFDKIDLF